jgi:hypothetical protein
MEEVSEDLHGEPAWLLPGFELFFDDLVDLVPKGLGNDGGAGNLAPLALRLVEDPKVALLAGAVEVIDALGAGRRFRV